MLPRSTYDERIADALARFPIGRRVFYQPIAGEPERIETRIRSIPWMLGHGAIVVAVECRAGGVLVDHLTPIEEGRR